MPYAKSPAGHAIGLKQLHPRAPALLILILLTVHGCGPGPSPSATGTADPTSTATTTATGPATATAPAAATATATANDGGDDPISRVVAWLLALAPGAPSGPEEVSAYLLLQEGSRESCAGVFDVGLPESSQTLYRGAAAACLAGIHGRSGRWQEAEEALDDLGGEPDGCLNQAVYSLLRSIVTAHREAPEARIRFHNSRRVRLPCPSIDRLAVSRDAAGTISVDIRGDRLGRVLGVAYRFVGCPAEIPDLDDHELVGPEAFVRISRSIRATIGAESVPAEASSIWVGLIAHPAPWIADAGCVPVPPPGEESNGEATATPAS